MSIRCRRIEPSATPRSEVIASLAAHRTLAVSLGGDLVVRRCPTDWKHELRVCGEPRGDYWLMQAIKRRLDPAETLNPGRFVH